jgi:membrane protein
MTTRSAKKRVRDFVDLWADCFAKHELLSYASAIAFQVLKSLIPLTLLALALLGALGQRNVWDDHVAPALRGHLARPVFRGVDYAAEKILRGETAGLIIFSAALTVWYVSGGVRAIMEGINRIYGIEENRPFQYRWPISIALAAWVTVCLVGAVLLVAAVPRPGGALGLLVLVARWGGAIVLLGSAAWFLVRFGPVERRPKRWVSAGAVVVVATWIVTSVIFRWYVSSVANFKSAIGQLTVFIVLMVYVYVSSIVFLVGVQLDELVREDASGEEPGLLRVLGFGR